jgi:hypothetical protein
VGVQGSACAGPEEFIDTIWDNATTCGRKAASAILTARMAQPRRPWIGAKTLDLIEHQNAARIHRHREAEVDLNKKIQQSAKDDRRADGRGSMVL